MATRIIASASLRSSMLTMNAAGRLTSRAMRRPILNAVVGALLVVLPVGHSLASVLPTEGWTFFDKTSNQQMPGARYRSSDLFGSLTFDTKSRQWRLLLVSGYDLPLPGGITLRAVYDEDKTRNRPHRIETLDVEPQPFGSLPPEIENVMPSTASARIIQLTLPRTFIIHLQGADHVIVDAGSFQHTMIMKGSAKAIAQIYVALGEGGGGDRSTITDIVNKTAVSAKPTDTPYAVQSAVPKNEPPKKNSATEDKLLKVPVYKCGDLEGDSDLTNHGECIEKYISELKNIEGTKAFDLRKRMLASQMGYDMYQYIKQRYPVSPWFNVCVDYGLTLKQERACLNAEREKYRDNINHRFDEAYSIMPQIFLGRELEEAVNKSYDNTMETYDKFKLQIDKRLSKNFEEMRIVGEW